MQKTIDPSGRIPLTRTTRLVPGDDGFAHWAAGLARRRAEAVGPPHPSAVAQAARLAEQERILFGRVRTRDLLRGATS